MSAPIRLLLVEDSKTYSMLIQGILAEMARGSYLVQVADALEPAIAAAGEFDPDVILLDLFLPDSEGLDTLRRMKSAYPDKAIVVLSSLDDEGTAFQTIRDGAQDYLFKSETDPKTLERAIRYSRERNQIEQALLRSQNLVREMLDSIQAGIVVIDPHDRSFVDANSVALDMFGASNGEVLGEVCHRYLCPDNNDQCPITHRGLKADYSESELRRADGERTPILKTAALVNLDGKARLVESFMDISALKEVEQELRHLSLTDELTGIANRRQFMYTAALETKRAVRYDQAISLLNIDVDDFKKINDTLGHQAGDLVLRKLAKLISHELRDSDIFGRVGGEEFGIILLETSLDAALEVAERLRKRIEGYVFQADDQEISCTISLGVASFDPETDNLDSWHNRADQALYLAKEKGRNRAEAL